MNPTLQAQIPLKHSPDATSLNNDYITNANGSRVIGRVNKEWAPVIVAAVNHNAVLAAACQAALDWLSAFGEDAPIIFGGEVELARQLSDALAAPVNHT